ncbi:MAG TPA: Hsp70 family protein [Candidatus Angelobacter sp.]|nr:Hsp70 family protein [Candidatus Angelobacter sp.]
MGKAIGIDLGTTNSVACFFDGAQQRVLLNTQNEELTPSVVMCLPLDDQGEVLVGRSAVSQAKLSPEDAIFSIKRLMGRPYNHEKVQHLKERVAYKVVESTESVKGSVAVIMGGRQYLPEDISALILKDIKQYSEQVLNGKITHAVITVPAYFSDPQIAATRQAGLKAGLIVKTVLPEPTAAALAFGAKQRLGGNRVLVFDLGGGTFDISIISIVEENYNVLEVYGDEFLGGDDFDNEIVKIILKYVQSTYGADLSDNGRFRITAKSEAEAAKKSLSNPATQSATIVIIDAARAGDKVINVKLKISREEFERAISSYVERCGKLVREALRHQNLTPDDISDVLLVGGSTAVPLVYQSVEEMFGKDKIRRDVNPMHCVAIGAGILAHKMRGVECPQCKKVCDESLTKCDNCGESLAAATATLEGLYLQESTVQPFGIQVVSDRGDPFKFEILVEKGTQVPMNEPVVRTFYTTEDKQTQIKIPVYQGMAASIKQNTPLGVVEYNLPSSRPLPLKHPVKVEFRLSRDRQIKVTVEVDGVRHEDSLKHEFDESSDKTELIASEADPETMTEREETLATLGSYIRYSDQFVQDYDTLLAAYQKKAIREAIEKAQVVLDKQDAENAQAWIRKLNALMATCGTASLIAQAYGAADIAADESVAADLRRKADDLRQFAEKRDLAAIRQLTDPVAALVREVHDGARKVRRIYAAGKFGGLLGER